MVNKWPLALALMVIRFWLGIVGRMLCQVNMSNQSGVLRGLGAIALFCLQDFMVMDKRKTEDTK